MFHKVINLIQAARLKTLIAGLCPVAIGGALSFYYTAEINWFYFNLILTASIAIQIATNFLNDAIDSDYGRDTEQRIGPSRGLVEPRLLKTLSYVLLALSFLIGVALCLKAGWWIMLIGVPAIILAYVYTGTNFSLSANGTADLFVIFYFGLIPVWSTNMILSGVNSSVALLMGLQCGFLCNSLLVINNLRDHNEDLSTGKKTLVVRFGRKFGLSLLFLCLFVPYFLNALLLQTDFLRSGLWAFMVFPLSAYIFLKVYKNAPSPMYNRLLGVSALNLLAFTFFVCIGILSA